MTHQLTEKIADDLLAEIFRTKCKFSDDLWDAIHDGYISRTDMVRSGADWQFGKDLRELLLILNMFEFEGKITQEDLEKIYFQFIEKMIPQQPNKDFN